MKRVIWIIVAVATLGGTGCAQHRCSCGNDGCGPGPLRPRGWAVHQDRSGGLLSHHRGKHEDEEAGMAGPAAAAVGYPYYTIRGPRDFLVDNPPSIGR